MGNEECLSFTGLGKSLSIVVVFPILSKAR